jgi:hypothetical protein
MGAVLSASRQLLAAGLFLVASSAGAAEDSVPGIQDNSFLVEEAYNQSPGVVQHIQTFMRSTRNNEWLYTFTQEWPVPGITHQLSYTLAYQRTGGTSRPADALFNYRYQLAGDGEARFACAPRLSMTLPEGSEDNGTGSGSVGIQALVPVSVVLGPKWMSHSNVGWTIVPSARDAEGDKATTQAFNLGQSFIWLASPRFNVLLESVWIRAQTVAGSGRTSRNDTFLVSPGIRWAYNYPSGLQIVPGIAFPFGVGPSRGQRNVFLYLSFEAPMWKPRGE